MRVAVAGGTGIAGRQVVSALTDAGHAPVVLARSTGVDITTGRGLAAALVGAEAVIDVSNVVTASKRTSVAFFGAGTNNLLAAGTDAGISHHLILSIVGVDLVNFGYYLGKRRQEEVAMASGRPVSILRATQFYEFAGQLLDRARGPVAIVPRMPVQPVAAREVADVLVALLVRGPVGMAPEFGGPERLELVRLARAVRSARGSRKVILPVRMPGAVGAAIAGGALIPKGNEARGVQTFAQWLSDAALAPR